MADLRFFQAFSMPDHDGFFGGISNQSETGFEIDRAGIGDATIFRGSFFSRPSFTIFPPGDDPLNPDGLDFEGRIRSVSFGELIDTEDDGTAILFTFSIANTSVSYASFESELVRGDALDIFRLFLDGSDELEGSGGADELFSFGGADDIDGNGGDDTLEGGSGDDTLDGGAGEDLLRGGSDEDVVSGGSGDDKLRGQRGEDRLNGGTEDDRIAGNQGDDTLNGDNGNDRLRGGRDDDLLNGGAENDKLFGGSGDDTLFGGTGDDTLRGDRGDDVMTGGLGADRFLFTLNSGDDTINDFDVNVDVMIDGNRDNLLNFNDAVSAELVGGNTILSLGASTITVIGVDLTDDIIG